MILCDTFREAARYATRYKGLALVFPHPGDQGYAVAFDREAQELEDDGHVPYSAVEVVIAASMPAVPDYPPPLA